jgi:undecaprenyl pyrophosphate phosphatase UppP
MEEFVLRFLIGGAVISTFALLGDVLRPKSFAGLFGAAPSIALATVGMTIARHGKEHAATEVRSMVLGTIAFCVYAYLVTQALVRYQRSTMATTIVLMPVWLGVSLGLYWMLLR